jgi:hypothetical protein
MAQSLLTIILGVWVVGIFASIADDDDQYAMYRAFVGGQNILGTSLQTVTSIVLSVEVQAQNFSMDACLGLTSEVNACPVPVYGAPEFVKETYLAAQVLFAESVLAASVSGADIMNSMMTPDAVQEWQGALGWASGNLSLAEADVAWYAGIDMQTMGIAWVAHTVLVVFSRFFLTRDMSIQCAGVSLVQVGAFASTASSFGSLLQAVSATGASAGALSVGGTALCDGSSRNALHCSGNSSGASSLVHMAPVVVQAINACPAQVQVCAFLGMGTIVRADNGCTFIASSNVTINSGSCRYGQTLVESCCGPLVHILIIFILKTDLQTSRVWASLCRGAPGHVHRQPVRHVFAYVLQCTLSLFVFALWSFVFFVFWV